MPRPRRTSRESRILCLAILRRGPCIWHDTLRRLVLMSSPRNAIDFITQSSKLLLGMGSYPRPSRYRRRSNWRSEARLSSTSPTATPECVCVRTVLRTDEQMPPHRYGINKKARRDNKNNNQVLRCPKVSRLVATLSPMRGVIFTFEGAYLGSEAVWLQFTFTERSFRFHPVVASSLAYKV